MYQTVYATVWHCVLQQPVRALAELYMLLTSSDQGFVRSFAALLLAASTMDAASLDAQIEALRLHSLGIPGPWLSGGPVVY